MKIKLQNHLYLVKLDNRSGPTVNHFSHRVDAYFLNQAVDFLSWGIKNIGEFNLWNHYLAERSKVMYIAPSWVVRYQDPHNEFTEFFLHKDVVSFVILNWKANE